MIRNHERRTYSANNNLAAREAAGRYLCLLNNDTLVTPGWLRALVDAADAEERLGVLGNRHLYPDSGLLQHAGMAFDAEGFPLHLHPGTDPELPAVNRTRELDCVTFACVLIPRRVFEELGGLDEVYRNGFEDCDFCLRAGEKGYRVVYTPAGKIYHYGQSTPGRKDHDDANWQRFRERWGGKVRCNLQDLLSADNEFNRSLLGMPRNRAPGRRGIHFAVDFSKANAFTWATVDLIMALHRKGVAVSIPVTPFLDKSIEPDKASLLRKMMREPMCGTWHIKWTHYWPFCFKQPLHGDVNAEFFCTNYRYREEGRHLDLWMRHVQVNEYRKLAVSGFNVDALEEVGVPADDCAVMPLGYSPEIDAAFPADRVSPRTDRKDLHILLVTNSSDLNRYGTDLAVKALGRAFGPDDPVVLHIKDYGHPGEADPLGQWIAAEKQFPRVEWHRTFLPKEDLLKLYASCDVQLAPFRGEGFAMKILDAMALGVPTMMPLFGGPVEFAADGTFLPLPFDEVPVGDCYDRDNNYIGEGAYWCEVRVDDMADILRSLPGRREELAAIGRRGLAHARGRFSWDQAADRLMMSLEMWESRRLARVARRRRPDAFELSVIIPTKDREDILAVTLDAYEKQTIDAGTYELIIVNDHGDLPALETLAAKHPSLPIRILDNHGPGGPAAARNLAMEQSQGTVVLITGDDIVPGEDFLEQHLEGHRRHPELETAFVGLTLWHEDLPDTAFMRYITGKGGQQFKYDDMKDDQPVAFDRLYTSNCSLKRAFVIEEEILFSTKYRYAAYEDVEFGYRLHLRGMVLRYLEKANGYHLHEMKPSSFIHRQRKVGRMLTLLAIQRPGFVPNEHSTFLRALEFMRAWPGTDHALEHLTDRSTDIIDQLTASYESILELGPLLEAPSGCPIVDADREGWKNWLEEGSGHAWEAINETVLRMGMAEEWAANETEAAKARAWLQLLTLPNTVGNFGLNWQMPHARPEFSAFLFPNSRLAYKLSLAIRKTPVLGGMAVRLEHSRLGQMLRGLLTRLVRKG